MRLGPMQQSYLIVCLNSYDHHDRVRACWGSVNLRVATSLVNKGLLQFQYKRWADGKVSDGHVLTEAGLELAQGLRIQRELERRAKALKVLKAERA